jgi:SRSO17 transposase
MIRAVVDAQVLRCRWVACDEGFGRNTDFLDQVATSGLWYFAAVPHDTRMWRQRPETVVPAWSGRGRKPRRVRLGPGQVQAEVVPAIAANVPTAQWSRQGIKEGSKGPLVADFAACRVVAVRAGLPGPEVWLILRRNLTTGELKASVCNAPATTPLKTLGRLRGMRWPIETCFEEGKQYLGMRDYEVRSWRGWHHHMTLCILAHFFLVRQQQRLKKPRVACPCRRSSCYEASCFPDGSLIPTGSLKSLAIVGGAIMRPICHIASTNWHDSTNWSELSL